MKNSKTRYITEIGVLSAIAAVLMLFDFPLWFAPAFYKIDVSELAPLIGGFALGPAAGIIIEAIKVVLHLLMKGTSTFFVGDISNFIVGCSFIIPASVIYKYNKSRKGAVIGMLAGTLTLGIVGSAFNAFLLIPAYSKILNLPIEQIVAMGNAVNSSINSVGSLVLYAVVPFNLLKGIVVSAITLLIYKKISVILKK